jgi:hypothetical protein
MEQDRVAFAAFDRMGYAPPQCQFVALRSSLASYRP